jgi:hypothetical protein
MRFANMAGKRARKERAKVDNFDPLRYSNLAAQLVPALERAPLSPLEGIE